MRDWLIDIREEKEFSRKEIADAVNVDVTYIAKIEKGQRDPSVILAMKLGKILNFEWQQFYKDLENEIRG